MRDRSRIALEFKHLISTMKEMKIFIHVAGDVVCFLVLACGISMIGYEHLPK